MKKQEWKVSCHCPLKENIISCKNFEKNIPGFFTKGRHKLIRLIDHRKRGLMKKLRVVTLSLEFAYQYHKLARFLPCFRPS
jgi:hypothetical protein